MYYEEHGNREAPLLIFLHGGGVSSWMWDYQIDYFTNYHCVTVDLLEHGKSQQSEPFSIERNAQLVGELIGKLAPNKKVTVIGFSLGAQIAIQLLSMHPYLVDYAVLNSPLVKHSKIAHKWIRPLIHLTYPLIQYEAFAKLQAKALYINQNHFEQYYTESRTISKETLINVLEENMSFTVSQSFKKVNTKMLVIVGEKEKGMMKKSAIHLMALNKNCESISISSIGHGASLAKPDLFNQITEDWITNLKPSP